jgi:hypothetical protein
VLSLAMVVQVQASRGRLQDPTGTNGASFNPER